MGMLVLVLCVSIYIIILHKVPSRSSHNPSLTPTHTRTEKGDADQQNAVGDIYYEVRARERESERERESARARERDSQTDRVHICIYVRSI
jgi:hypothetical protein